MTLFLVAFIPHTPLRLGRPMIHKLLLLVPLCFLPPSTGFSETRRSTSEWLAMLSHKKPQVIRKALYFLGPYARNNHLSREQTRSFVSRSTTLALKHKAISVRLTAALQVVLYYNKRNEFPPTYYKLLQDPYPLVRQYVWNFANLNKLPIAEATRAAFALSDHVKDVNESIRWSALGALFRTKKRRLSRLFAIPKLQKRIVMSVFTTMGRGRGHSSHQAYRLLVRWSPWVPALCPLLVKKLKSNNRSIQEKLLHILKRSTYSETSSTLINLLINERKQRLICQYKKCSMTTTRWKK